MTVAEARRISLQRQLEPLVTREISGIAAIDTAIAHERAPDYVVMFQDARSGKQANIEQMATLIRMQGGTPDERGGVRKALAKTQAGIAARVSTTATLQCDARRGDRVGHAVLRSRRPVDALARRTLRKALGRALVHTHLLTAHLAKRIGSEAEARLLPVPLTSTSLAPSRARACVVIWIGLVRPVRWSARIPTRIRTCARRAMTRSWRIPA